MWTGKDLNIANGLEPGKFDLKGFMDEGPTMLRPSEKLKDHPSGGPVARPGESYTEQNI